LIKKTIIDLGSGWGSLAIYLAIKNKDKTIIGYELSPIPLFSAKLIKNIFRIKNLKLYRKDFLDEKFKKEYLYICYLFPKGMKSIEKKIKKETLEISIISSTFALPSITYSKKEILKDMFRTPFYFYNL
jgi:tRNA G46 methylase TrmB